MAAPGFVDEVGELPLAPSPSCCAPCRNVDDENLGHLDYMEGELGKSAWFAGDDFTAGDVQMSFPLEAAASRGGLDASRAKLLAFLDRVHARPAYKRALERGGAYESPALRV
jgi:glutathione S-transferase